MLKTIASKSNNKTKIESTQQKHKGTYAKIVEIALETAYKNTFK